MWTFERCPNEDCSDGMIYCGKCEESTCAHDDLCPTCKGRTRIAVRSRGFEAIAANLNGWLWPTKRAVENWLEANY